MNLRRLVSTIGNLCKLFLFPPKQWWLPEKSDILIYDACGAEVFLPYLTKYRVKTLFLRGETINLPCLFLASLSISFWKGKILQAYVDSFINAVSPSVVITFIDNNPAFYTISSRFPKTKTIFIQNGTRGVVGDVFSSLTREAEYHVDYMLVHTNEIGKFYQQFISGCAIPVGSMKNNAVKISHDCMPGAVLFISQYLDELPDHSPLWIDTDGAPVSWQQFMSYEILVTKFLSKYCLENGLELKICGRSTGADGPDHQFYKSHLAESEWEYLPHPDRFSSYNQLDAAQIVVSIDSTLAYEAIGRGKRTAVFSCRTINKSEPLYLFGWPAAFPGKGVFWTDEPSEAEFSRVMDYLLKASDDEWEQLRTTCVADLMEFDPGNTRFIGLIEKLAPSHFDQQ